MKRAMRCHDFGSGQGVRRRPYREYGLGARRRAGPKLVPALRVAAKIGADCVGRLNRIRDTACGVLVITNFGSNAHRGFVGLELGRRLGPRKSRIAEDREGEKNAPRSQLQRNRYDAPARRQDRRTLGCFGLGRTGAAARAAAALKPSGSIADYDRRDAVNRFARGSSLDRLF